MRVTLLARFCCCSCGHYSCCCDRYQVAQKEKHLGGTQNIIGVRGGGRQLPLLLLLLLAQALQEARGRDRWARLLVHSGVVEH